MGCVPGYRVGHPRITEAMNRMDPGRGTGYMGTGIYFYGSRQAMEKDKNFAKGEQDGYELACACKHPLVIKEGEDGWGTAWGFRFSDFSRSLVRTLSGWEDEKPMVGILDGVVPECSGYEGYDRCRKLALESIETTRKCQKDAGTPWASTCSQPVNHFLERLGYDCVIPGSLADRNDVGSVLLKEPLVKCLGEVEPGTNLPLDKLKDCVGLVGVSSRPGELLRTPGPVQD